MPTSRTNPSSSLPPYRYNQTKSLLGPELFERVRSCKVLVVGAGGIGCELLKNLTLTGFRTIELIDLDTIDLSNLNRQFLFRRGDVKKSKALVAGKFASGFNPTSSSSGMDGEADSTKGVNIHARHGNIKDPMNDVEWMKGFDLVMGALDNLDARRHVNKLCIAAGVPLIESGTQGYLGQVTPIVKDRTECFDCVPKDPPKSFPVCTIRATPSEPIHCIVWGKSYLLNKLFGEDDEATDESELEKAKADGENADEIDNLKAEASAFREIRSSLSLGDSSLGPIRVFTKIFKDDIERLLSMEDMWKVAGRVKPVALDYEKIMSGEFEVPPVIKKAGAAGVKKEDTGSSTNGHAETSAAGAAKSNGNGPEHTSTGLKDQRQLSIKDNLELFIDSCNRLSARSIAHPSTPILFDKDDDDTLDFVLATANLRAMAYGIATKTRFEVKEMAGNIIPAIATTNAIISGLIVLRALNLLRLPNPDWSACKNTFLKGEPSRPLGSYNLQPPDSMTGGCSICAEVWIGLRCDPSKLTLGVFIEDLVREWIGWRYNSVVVANEEDEGEEGEQEEIGIQIYNGNRLLSDSDFDDNHEKTLGELGLGRGDVIMVVDEDEKWRGVGFWIGESPDPSSEKAYILPSPNPPHIPLRTVAPPIPTADTNAITAPAQIVGKKRAFEDENGDDFEVIEGGPGPKKMKMSGDSAAAPDEKKEGASNGNGNADAMIVDDEDDFEIL